MRGFKKVVATFIALGLCSFYFCVKTGSIHWEKTLLRVNVQRTVDSMLRRNRELAALIISGRHGGVACVALCNLRIKLLKNILKNVLLLPVDITEYSHRGFLEAGCYEIKKLEEIAGQLPDHKQWGPEIQELIRAYRSIKSEYSS